MDWTKRTSKTVVCRHSQQMNSSEVSFGVYVRSFIISSFERPCRRSVLGIFPALLVSAFGAHLYDSGLLIMLTSVSPLSETSRFVRRDGLAQ